MSSNIVYIVCRSSVCLLPQTKTSTIGWLGVRGCVCGCIHACWCERAVIVLVEEGMSFFGRLAFFGNPPILSTFFCRYARPVLTCTKANF